LLHLICLMRFLRKITPSLLTTLQIISVFPQNYGTYRCIDFCTHKNYDYNIICIIISKTKVFGHRHIIMIGGWLVVLTQYSSI